MQQDIIPPQGRKPKPRPINGPVPVPDEAILNYDPEAEQEQIIQEQKAQRNRQVLVYTTVVGILLVIGGVGGYFLYNTSGGRITASNSETRATQTPTQVPDFNL